MNPEWSYDFRSGIIGKQKLTEHATEFAQRTLYRAKSLPTKEEITFTAMDVVNDMSRVILAHSGGGPVFYQYKDSIIKLRDDMRNEIEKLGFSRNSISAIEVSDFRFKVKLKAWRELITNDTKYKRDMGPIEFTGGSIYALTVNLKW